MKLLYTYFISYSFVANVDAEFDNDIIKILEEIITKEQITKIETSLTKEKKLPQKISILYFKLLDTEPAE